MLATAKSGYVLDGKYALQSVLGSGRFGTVYRATHVALQKPVAIKVLHAGSAMTARDFERFRVEAEALGRLDHPHIVRVTDFGVDPQDPGLPYLAMEVVEGRPLDEQVLPPGREGLATAVTWLTQIAAALDHAHAAGVAHGDLSGRNVLVSGDGAEAIIKIIDFGLAGLTLATPEERRSAAPDADECTLRIDVTPECAAPERLRGEPPSPAADVYALGALACRLVTGRYPFEGPSSHVLQARLINRAPALSTLRPDAPRELDDAIQRGLAARASDRPTSASQLAGAIAAAVHEHERRQWRRREAPRRLAIAGGLALTLAGVMPWFAESPPIQRLEGGTEDIRFALSAPREPDARLLLVTLDDAALDADPRPLVDQASAFAEVLSAALLQGASTVAFDLLLPREWATDEEFGAFLAQHSDRIVLGLAADTHGITGTEPVDPMVAGVLGPEATSRLFALVTHAPATDGVIRRGRTAVPDVTGAARPTLAGRVAELVGTATMAAPGDWFVIDYRIDATVLPRAGWQEFTQAVRGGARFDDRALIIGADFTGSGDEHRVPGPRRLSAAVSGLALQGVTINTLLQRAELRDAPPAAAGVLGGVAAFAAGLSVLLVRRPRVGMLGVAGTLAVVLLAAQAAWLAGLMVPVVAPAVACMVAALVATGVRYRWSWTTD
ncbi:MAG: protein kinase [Vicinamibacterales bacterium]